MDTTQQPQFESQVTPNAVSHRNDSLKIIALLTMLIDHVGYLFFPGQMLFRTIGRIAFPIFAYQIAVGFQKTSNRKNYALRLFIFACISQIPYSWFNPELFFEFQTLNIMFTFLIAIGVLQTLESGIIAFKSSDFLKGIGWSLLSIGFLILPEVSRFNFDIGTEYGTTGILFVLLFYFLGKSIIPLVIGYVALSAFGAYYSAARWYHYSMGKSFIESFMSFKELWSIHVEYNHALADLSGIFFQSRSFIAVPIIWLMERIASSGMLNVRLNKYVGYLFYPGHITILVLIKFFMVQ